MDKRSKEILLSVKYLFFPKRCCVCGKTVYRDEDHCEKCDIDRCRIEGEVCPYCAQEISRCVCSYEDRRYDYLSSVFYYVDEAGECIKNFKFNSFFDNGKYLAHEISKKIEERYYGEKIDIALGVPITGKRKRKRGFCQTDYLLKIVSKETGIPYDKKVLIKVRETAPQVGLKAKERKENLKDAFSVREGYSLKGKTVLLLDDVKTTGATLNECTKTLKKAGAKRVICITAATAKNILKEADEE